MDHGTYDELQAYSERVSMEEPPLLNELYRATYLKCIHPRMISGRLLGRTLSFISKLIQPERILEIGTYTGYSALCLAEGLSPSGRLISIDCNDELQALQQSFIARSPYAERIELLVGQALDTIPQLEDKFDLVFLDADKENYQLYLPLILEKTKVGGVILIDNMLWEGKVLFDAAEDDIQTQAIKALTETIRKDERLEQLMLPVRDGVLAIRVLG